MKNIINKLATFIRNSRIARTYVVTYAPADSRNPHLPIQKYSIIEHPRKLAWKSQAGNRLFTALSAKDENQFNADRKSTRLNSSHVSEYRMPSSA